MTVQTQFHNWQDRPLQPDPKRCAPLCITWRNYLLDTWGGQDLGCYVARPVVGGSSPSSHGSGAAHDWRYQDPGIGRQRMLDEVLPWLIDNSQELGIQAIHDYVGCRIWRPPATSGRPAQVSPECGWRAQSPGSQMGQSWALWLHLEVLNTRWSDTRSVDEMLSDSPAPGPTPIPDLEDDVMALLTRYSDNSIWVVATDFSWKFCVTEATHDSIKNSGQYSVVAIDPGDLEIIPGKQ